MAGEQAQWRWLVVVAMHACLASWRYTGFVDRQDLRVPRLSQTPPPRAPFQKISICTTSSHLSTSKLQESPSQLPHWSTSSWALLSLWEKVPGASSPFPSAYIPSFGGCLAASTPPLCQLRRVVMPRGRVSKTTSTVRRSGWTTARYGLKDTGPAVRPFPSILDCAGGASARARSPHFGEGGLAALRVS